MSHYIATLAQGYVNEWRSLKLADKRAFVRNLRSPGVTGPERLARLRALAAIELES